MAAAMMKVPSAAVTRRMMKSVSRPPLSLGVSGTSRMSSDHARGIKGTLVLSWLVALAIRIALWLELGPGEVRSFTPACFCDNTNSWQGQFVLSLNGNG